MLKVAIQNYLVKTYSFNENKADQESDKIIQAWQSHHINGIHPDGKIKLSDVKNIALVDQQVHQYVTARNKEIIENEVMKIPTIFNDDVDKLIFRLLVTCAATNVNPSTIFRISLKNFDSILNGIPNIVDNEFRTAYPKSTTGVIYLSELKLPKDFWDK